MHFYVKRDCLLFSVIVKLFFDFFVMREKAKYLCVKLFLKEVLGTLFNETAHCRIKVILV